MDSFSFSDITLKDGLLKDTLWEMIRFYRDMSFDSIFKYLRQSAGEPAPGVPYLGWYARGRGEANIAQWTSAMCRIYAITGEEQDRARAAAMVDEFWRLYDLLKDSPEPVFTAHSFYAIEKVLMALIDYKEYIGIELRDRAAEIVRFALDHLDKARAFGDNGTEWYTIGESFYRASKAFALPEATEVAKAFEYRDFWDLFHDNADPFSRRPEAGLYSEFCHAYSHVNSLNSCAMAYRETHDPYYLDSLKSFYRFLRDEELMCTGGYGAEYEHLMPKDNIVRALRRGHDSFETQCNTYAAYRVVRQLSELTNAGEYSEWAERLIYNATVATIPMTKDGKVIYYSDYNMSDACKKNRDDEWTCCTGTRPLLVCEMERLLYFHDEDGLYIAQYTPSALRWKRGEADITLEQDTEFPKSDRVCVTLRTDKPSRFALRLRKPRWIRESISLEINGQPSETCADEQGWITILREWTDGDRLTLTLPQPLWQDALDKAHDAPTAFLHGPVVLAAAYDDGRKPIPCSEVRGFLQKLRPVEGKPLHYDVEGHPDIHFKPFYEFVENEHYSLYFDTGVHATQTVPIY